VRGRQAVATRYAKALFALAKEQDRSEAVGAELGTALEVLEGNEALGGFLARPWASAAAKRETVAAIADRLGLSRLTRDFMALLALRGRVDHLSEIREAYADLADADQGRVRARVRTATPLTDVERLALATRLGQGLGGVHVVLEENVDRNLLGGFIAEVGSTVLDGSLDGQLARMRERLVRG